MNIETYNIPEYIQVSHKDAMSEKFNTKKDVFTEFGAADKKDVLEGIEVWTYNLAERTTGVGTKINISNTETKQNKNNTNLMPIDRSIESSSTSISNTVFGSTTRNDYVTFWFEEDKVVKWESLGLNLQYRRLNSEFDYQRYEQYQKEVNGARTKSILIFGSVGVALLLLQALIL